MDFVPLSQGKFFFFIAIWLSRMGVTRDFFAIRGLLVNVRAWDNERGDEGDRRLWERVFIEIATLL
jgi:hypothetical protein